MCKNWYSTKKQKSVKVVRKTLSDIVIGKNRTKILFLLVPTFCIRLEENCF